MTQELRDEFAHLEDGDVLAEARADPVAELFFWLVVRVGGKNTKSQINS